MAMEKLILRSVLWGADKIPDRWFDKVPGGFYSPNSSDKNGQSADSRGRKNSNDSSANRRRSSQVESRHRSDDTRDSGYHSDSRYRHNSRGDRADEIRRSSRRDSDPKGSRRVEELRESESRRRRSFDDEHAPPGDKYGDAPRDSRNRSHPRAPYGPDREYANQKQQPSAEPAGRRSRTPRENPAHPGYPAGTAAVAATSMPLPKTDGRANLTNDSTVPTSRPRSMTSPQSQQARPSSASLLGPPQQPQNAGASSQTRGTQGYVPYSHIYSNPTVNSMLPPPQASRTAPPTQNSAQFLPPVVPPPMNYHQNTDSQLAPTAEAAGAGAAYTGQNGGGYYGAKMMNLWDRGRNDSGYESPPISDFRVSRSERPPSGYATTLETRSRSRPRDDKTFDTSTRALGYGAVGALAGGLFGSELPSHEKAVPIAIGATIGALGANAYAARERYVDQNQLSNRPLRSSTFPLSSPSVMSARPSPAPRASTEWQHQRPL